MRKKQLLGFVEDMGYEYEHLLGGAMKVEEGESLKSLKMGVMLTNLNILVKHKAAQGGGGDDEEDVYEDEKEDEDESGHENGSGEN